MGGIDVTPIVGDGAVYVLDYKGYLWSFDAITGAENWPVPTKCNAADGVFEVSTPAYDDGIVYVAASSGSAGNGAGRINAVYANDGTIRESCYYGLSGFQINTPVRYADGKVYFGNWKGGHTHTEDNGTYYCVDADDVCNLIWSKTADYVTGYYWAGAAIVDDYPGEVDGYIVYGDDRANVTCRNKDTGEFVDYINVSEQCGITTVEEIRSSIVWNEDTGRIYFTGKSPQSPPSGHAYAVAFNSLTGDLGGDGAVGGGSCEWDNSIGYSTSTPVVYNDRVYVGAGGMYGGGYGLKCLNEADGTLRYETSGIGAVQASPAVSAFGGGVYIYFTTNVLQGTVYCFEDTDSGLVERWAWLPPNYQHILQGVAISKGMVYFGNDAGYVYALAGDCGNVNCDDEIDGADVTALRNRVRELVPLASEWAGNVNGDDEMDGADVTALRNRVRELVPLACRET
jgi:outer membrane protein assembly factor BamB